MATGDEDDVPEGPCQEVREQAGREGCPPTRRGSLSCRTAIDRNNRMPADVLAAIGSRQEVRPVAKDQMSLLELLSEDRRR